MSPEREQGTRRALQDVPHLCAQRYVTSGQRVCVDFGKAMVFGNGASVRRYGARPDNG